MQLNPLLNKNNRHNIYCISGLGADYRIFNQLKFNDAEIHFIHWVTPEPNDTMASFALKLAEQIKHTEIILLGVSYGGMLASEMSRQLPQALPQITLIKTILISSCKCRKEFPHFLNLASKLNLHKAMPYRLVLRSNFVNRFVFDLHSKEEELYLKRTMLRENKVEFIQRSLKIIMKWRQQSLPKNVVHIHGTSDRLLTPANIKADHWITNGGHFMIWNRAREISVILNNILQEIGATKIKFQ